MRWVELSHIGIDFSDSRHLNKSMDMAPLLCHAYRDGKEIPAGRDAREVPAHVASSHVKSVCKSGLFKTIPSPR